MVNYSAIRQYFEVGCLCIILGDIRVRSLESDKDAAERYVRECECSRHPEPGLANHFN